MNRIGFIFILLTAAIVLIFWQLRTLHFPARFNRIVDQILDNSASFDSVANVERSEIGFRAYAYEKNQFIDVLEKHQIDMPNTAESQRRLPVFRSNNDVFVVLEKQRNNVFGIAISDDLEFVSNLTSDDFRFSVTKIRPRVYWWGFDIEAPRN